MTGGAGRGALQPGGKAAGMSHADADAVGVGRKMSRKGVSDFVIRNKHLGRLRHFTSCLFPMTIAPLFFIFWGDIRIMMQFFEI